MNTRAEFARSHARGQVYTGCDARMGGRMRCPGRIVKKMSALTNVNAKQNYNTLGQVIDYSADGSVYVQWENGTTGYYGMWHLPLDLIKKA